MSSLYKAATTNDDQQERSTRDQVLKRSLEMINESGMVDFRIDTLAASLGLSPGNITYHFSRKEEICVALWEQYLAEYGNVQRQLTTLLDIKQLYLINRVNIYLSYKYRGVVMFRSSDIGALERDHAIERRNEKEHNQISDRVMYFLEKNNYLEADVYNTVREVINNIHYVIMRWSINLAFMSYTPKQVEKEMDMLSLLSLHAMYPTFNSKGRTEYDEVLAKVKAGDLSGESMGFPKILR